MLTFVILAAVATLCLSQNIGDLDYIACDMCKVPDDELPEEGKMVCFQVKTEYISTVALVYKCHEKTCGKDDFFCVPETKCGYERGNISIPKCKLERKTAYRFINYMEGDEWDMYHIYSPHYYSYNDYPNNTYCVWNVSNSGFVTYTIMDQQLQEPETGDCNGVGCDCPDSVKITGSYEVKLCGSSMPSTDPPLYMVSSGGLNVKFCSDNKYTAKGFDIVAYKPSNHAKEKRETKQLKNNSSEASGDFTGEINIATCQYDYMMRVSQPDVPCPDNLTILSMLQYHNKLMSAPIETEEVCKGMKYPTQMSSMMPSMNKIEMCAVEYLYRTRDCKFARMVVKSTNKKLSGVAHAVITNKFFKRPKWMKGKYTKCEKSD